MGIWAALLFAVSLAPAVAQAPAPTADQEIQQLLAADQAARETPPTPTLAREDAARLARAKVLIEADAFKDAHSYDAAATLFQHGQQPDDHLLARELALVACFERASYTGMPALAEDRYLVRVGRLQRFGAHFLGSEAQAKPAPIQETGDNLVTDALRLDFLQPTLQQAKTQGLPFIQGGKSFEQALPRIQTRMKPEAHGPAWITDPALSHADFELTRLESLPAKDLSARRSGVLALYRRDALFLPSDYAHAGAILLTASQSPEDLLLAHEFATLAVMRLHAPAWRTYAESWDRFAQAIGQPTRYGTIPGSPRAGSVPPPIRRALGWIATP